MKMTNWLEAAWTPEWDLGFQVEFDFVEERIDAPTRAAAKEASSDCWSRAGAAVLGHGAGMDRRLGLEGGSLGSLLAYFETAFSEEANRYE